MINQYNFIALIKIANSYKEELGRLEEIIKQGEKKGVLVSTAYYIQRDYLKSLIK
jgi:hypothetical protein